ncbi:class I adenylate-forming enzyme family protein [Streptomyces albipurpureus]|uniref:Long-chain fatty acid--CoA ligase n=1 Tax=Streptomyces albipurpureus TaxID=2897419 RepID=A0ABT0UN12_9ACTN|nr:AMP-binding protein [Streptomyces sp. CWNU-1]MCM2389702.1 long-chain fatty acid--CoA ligase [Streptomyces sp. CWNU-1]
MLFETIRGIAAGRPEALAVETTDGESCTYAQLIERTELMGAGLSAQGVRPGDTVVCHGLPNTPDYVAFILAVAALRACYVPVLADFDRSAVDRVLTLTQPVLWVGSPHPGAGETAPPRIDLAALPVTGTTEAPLATGHADRVFRRLWTSGSTKLPKLVSWKQGPFVRERLRWVADVGIEESDVVFCRHTLDVAHATDLHVFAALLVGARLILTDPRTPPAELLEQLSQRGVTMMSALPSHYEDLVKAAKSHPTGLPTLRRPLCGGAYISPALTRISAETLGIHIRQVYGSTEFGLGLGNMDDIVQSQAGMVPVSGVKARLAPLDESSGPDLGVLVLVSDCTSEGYLHDDEANASTFRGGEFWTGDIAERTADGSYRVLGRTTDAIKSANGPLPAPVLDALITERCPAVADSVSLTADPETYAPNVLVIARASADASAGTAIAQVEGLLRELSLDGVVREVESVPRTIVGKPDKPLIRRSWAAPSAQ